MSTKRGFVTGMVLLLAAILFLFAGFQWHQAYAGDLAPGMVDMTAWVGLVSKTSSAGIFAS